jgi:hypothetical protein
MTQLYRVWARFEPDHVNPLTGRKGQWRVTATGGTWFHTPIMRSPRYPSEIGVLSHKRYPIGSIIRPHKELNRVLAMRGAA